MRIRHAPSLRPVALTALAGLALLALGLSPAAAAGASPAGQAVGQAVGPESLGFKKSFVVEIRNPSPVALENHAVIIDVAAIRAAVAWDFNTYMYALFEDKGGEYSLVVSQADDLDKDRYHDEIVLIRTLPPSSTTRLLCYYTPERSFQLMPAQKAFARGGWEAGLVEAGWESNLIAFKLVRGRIEFYGKLQSGLILKGFPKPDTKPQDWGMDVLDAGESAGLGGLILWDGAARVPLFGESAPRPTVTVLAPGPVRALVKAEYPAVRTAAGEVSLTVFYSAFAEGAYSRQDIVVPDKAGRAVVAGPGLEKLPGETTAFDKSKGFLAVWGKGADKAGEVGLAAIFRPAAFSGTDETAVDRGLKLNARPGAKLTYWLAGAWERGLTTPGVPEAKNWPRKVEELAARLLAPVTVEFKAR
jgi:Domain of unknown function (DUF4861)